MCCSALKHIRTACGVICPCRFSCVCLQCQNGEQNEVVLHYNSTLFFGKVDDAICLYNGKQRQRYFYGPCVSLALDFILYSHHRLEQNGTSLVTFFSMVYCRKYIIYIYINWYNII